MATEDSAPPHDEEKLKSKESLRSTSRDGEEKVRRHRSTEDGDRSHLSKDRSDSKESKRTEEKKSKRSEEEKSRRSKEGEETRSRSPSRRSQRNGEESKESSHKKRSKSSKREKDENRSSEKRSSERSRRRSKSNEQSTDEVTAVPPVDELVTQANELSKKSGEISVIDASAKERIAEYQRQVEIQRTIVRDELLPSSVTPIERKPDTTSTSNSVTQVKVQSEPELRTSQPVSRSRSPSPSPLHPRPAPVPIFAPPSVPTLLIKSMNQSSQSMRPPSPSKPSEKVTVASLTTARQPGLTAREAVDIDEVQRRMQALMSAPPTARPPQDLLQVVSPRAMVMTARQNRQNEIQSARSTPRKAPEVSKMIEMTARSTKSAIAGASDLSAVSKQCVPSTNTSPRSSSKSASDDEQQVSDRSSQSSDHHLTNKERCIECFLVSVEWFEQYAYPYMADDASDESSDESYSKSRHPSTARQLPTIRLIAPKIEEMIDDSVSQGPLRMADEIPEPSRRDRLRMHDDNSDTGSSSTTNSRRVDSTGYVPSTVVLSVPTDHSKDQESSSRPPSHSPKIPTEETLVLSGSDSEASRSRENPSESESSATDSRK